MSFSQHNQKENMSPYIAIVLLVGMLLGQTYKLGKAEYRFMKIREAIHKTIQNDDLKTKDKLLDEFLERVCNAIHD
jgi:hypothetical protein